MSACNLVNFFSFREFTTELLILYWVKQVREAPPPQLPCRGWQGQETEQPAPGQSNTCPPGPSKNNNKGTNQSPYSASTRGHSHRETASQRWNACPSRTGTASRPIVSRGFEARIKKKEKKRFKQIYKNILHDILLIMYI